MKRILFLAALLIAALFMLCGCSDDPTVIAISVKDHSQEQIAEASVGGFVWSDYTLIVSHDNGETEEIALDSSMVSASDRAKLFQVGEHTISINYKNLSTDLKVSIKRNEFGEISFPENINFVYDGGEHTVELVGEIPAQAKITYPSGNTFVNAGTYDVSAVVSCDGYVTKRLSSKVTIERATYDMSDVKLESKEVAYNGRSHMITISGKLPDGVSDPTYYVNNNPATSVTEAGTYTVKAVFNNLNTNYHPIPTMEATITVRKAAHVLGELYLSVFDENAAPINSKHKIYDGKEVEVALGIESTLPDGVSVFYKVARNGGEEGEALSEVLLKDVGLYTVTAYFKLSDPKNYEGIAPIEMAFEIKRAAYPIGEVHLDSDITVFNGKEQPIRIDGTVPVGVSVSYEYYLDGVLQTGSDGKPLQAVVNAGKYTVKAVFAHSEPNYLEIPSLSAQFEILPFTPDVSGISFEQIEACVYDGEEKFLHISGKLPEGLTVRYEYYLDGVLQMGSDGNPLQAVVNAGSYTVNAIFVPINANYTAHALLSATFYVDPQEIDISGVSLEGEEFTYDGEEKLPGVLGIPENLRVGKTEIYSLIDGAATVVGAAVDAGNYRVVVTLVGENANYVPSGSGTVSLDFVINDSAAYQTALQTKAECNGDGDGATQSDQSELDGIDAQSLELNAGN